MIHALLFHLFVCIVLFEISFSLLQKYKYSEISLYFFFTLIINVRKYAMCGVEKQVNLKRYIICEDKMLLLLSQSHGISWTIVFKLFQNTVIYIFCRNEDFQLLCSGICIFTDSKVMFKIMKLLISLHYSFLSCFY